MKVPKLKKVNSTSNKGSCSGCFFKQWKNSVTNEYFTTEAEAIKSKNGKVFQVCRVIQENKVDEFPCRDYVNNDVVQEYIYKKEN